MVTTHIKKYFLVALSLGIFCGGLADARAEESCLIIRNYETNKILKQEGDCTTSTTPASTFKIPLALMGYDAGILIDEQTPAWPFKDGYHVNKDNDKLTTTPTTWEANSVVWYSQKLTTELGLEEFKKYVTLFTYGNMDLTGDAGKNNGLTRSWLTSSLEISPLEQTEFLYKFLQQELPLSPKATAMTMAILPTFQAADDWKVTGKTGTGNLRQKDGTPDRNHPVGWFVGWAEKGDIKIIFARRVIGDKPQEGMGLKVREAFLAEFLTSLK